MLIKELDIQESFEWLENLDIPAIAIDITKPNILYTNKPFDLLTAKYSKLDLRVMLIKEEFLATEINEILKDSLNNSYEHRYFINEKYQLVFSLLKNYQSRWIIISIEIIEKTNLLSQIIPKTVVNAIPFPLIILSKDLAIINYNRQMEDWLLKKYPISKSHKDNIDQIYMNRKFLTKFLGDEQTKTFIKQLRSSLDVPIEDAFNLPQQNYKILIDDKQTIIDIYTIPAQYHGELVIFCIFHDITEQKSLQEALLELDHKYRTILDAESIYVTIFYPEPDFKLIFTNQTFKETLMQSKATEKRQNDIDEHISILELISSVSKEQFISIMKSLVDTAPYESSTPISYELYFENQYKEHMTILCQFTKILLNGEPVYQMLGLDVTPRWRFERVFMNSIEIDNQILQLIHEGVYILDPNGLIIYANAAFINMFDNKGEIMGKSLLEFVHSDDVSKIKSTLANISNQRLEVRLKPDLAKNDKIIHVLLHQTTIVSETGVIEGSLGTVTDISDIKNLSDQIQQRTQELIQTEKMASLGLLVSEVAHEINNPISFLLSNTLTSNDYLKSITQYLNFLEETALGNTVSSNQKFSKEYFQENQKQIKKAQQQLKIPFILEDLPKLLKSNERGLERVRDVVHDLRIVSRASHVMPPMPIKIHESLDLVLNLLKHKMRGLINIKKEYLSPPNTLVFGNSSKLDQIWVNLILNAIQAIEEKASNSGQILIKTLLIGTNWIRVIILDNGIGISPDNKEKIFHPFFTTKPPTKGTGLGLSICLRIVQEFGGSIGIKSEGEGKGAEVTIDLPIYNET